MQCVEDKFWTLRTTGRVQFKVRHVAFDTKIVNFAKYVLNSKMNTMYISLDNYIQ